MRKPMEMIVLDIETRKVPVDSWVFSRNRPVNKRWQVFMVGVAFPTLRHGVTLFEGSEITIMTDLDLWLAKNAVEQIYYSATRSFDEMVLKGRFINARREFLPKPGPWPRLISADAISWVNIGPTPPNPDGLGEQIPKLYDAGERELVRRHCIWDVVSLAGEVE